MAALTVPEIQAVIAERIPAGLVVPEHTATEHFYRHVPSDRLFASVTTKTGILESGGHLKKWAARLAVEHIDANFQYITPENKKEIYDAAVMAHIDRFEDAGDIGTIGHGYVEDYLLDWMKNGQPVSDIRAFVKVDDVRAMAIVRSAEAFIRDYDAVPVASEQFVCSLGSKRPYRPGYAGTMDALMMVARPYAGREGDPNCDHLMMDTKVMHVRRCIKCDRKTKRVLTLVDWKTSNSIDKPGYALQVACYWKAFIELTGIKPQDILIVRLDKSKKEYQVMRVLEPQNAYNAAMDLMKVWEWLHDGKPKLTPLVKREQIILNF